MGGDVWDGSVPGASPGYLLSGYLSWSRSFVRWVHSVQYKDHEMRLLDYTLRCFDLTCNMSHSLIVSSTLAFSIHCHNDTSLVCMMASAMDSNKAL